MVQDYNDDTYDPAHIGGVDLQNIEDNFAALKSNFSGGSNPGNTVAGMLWFDTGNEVLKLRDVGNSQWYTLLQGNAQLELWVYSNVAIDGWSIDGAVTDQLLALKGGSTYLTGGANAGSWTWPSHTLTIPQMPSHTHPPGGGAGNFMTTTGGGVGAPGDNYSTFSNTGSTGGDGSHSHGSTTFRPAAAVGTLQYPNG
jgi:hypothetical protein